MDEENQVVDAMNDTLLDKVDSATEDFIAETKASEEVLVQDDIWKELIGVSWNQWPDEPRNLHQTGSTCSLWGRSVGDMSEQELILFIGFLNHLCSQQNSMLHFYAEMEKTKAEAKESVVDAD